MEIGGGRIHSAVGVAEMDARSSTAPQHFRIHGGVVVDEATIQNTHLSVKPSEQISLVRLLAGPPLAQHANEILNIDIAVPGTILTIICIE